MAVFVFAYIIGFEIYKHPDSVSFPTEYLSVAAGTMLYALLFVILTQLVFVLVLYESIHWCSKCLVRRRIQILTKNQQHQTTCNFEFDIYLLVWFPFCCNVFNMFDCTCEGCIQL